MPPQKNKMTQCQLPAGCKEPADVEWWYHAPGDIDSENMAPLIHLCKKHVQSYLDHDYPPPKFISLRQQDKSEFKEEAPKLSDEWAETCSKCGRRSNVIALSKNCPFCFSPPQNNFCPHCGNKL